jgi:putative serine protease PepD
MTQGPAVDPTWGPPGDSRAPDHPASSDTQPVARQDDTQALPADGWVADRPAEGPADGPAENRGEELSWGASPEPLHQPSWPPPAATAWDAPAAHAAPQGPRGRRGIGALATTGLVLGCLLVGVMGGLLGDELADRLGARGGTDIPVATGPGPDRPEGSVADVAARVLPSTVSIEVASSSAQGSGSGFVLREDGLILTNNHVIAEAAEAGEIRVVFSDGTEADAEVVGRTADYDLAVLRVDRTGLVPLDFGDSDDVVVGDPVIAIGAPLGLESTVTTGIVSALNRPVAAGPADENSFINAIQTDAAINPGNSGGPLVNMAGQVIGINSAIARNPSSDAAGNIGLGFAIPSKQAARTAEQLIDTGKATYPIIGVLLDRSYTGEGVRVTEDSEEQDAVTPDGPADAAGIRPGDVITGFNGRPVTEPDQLIVGIRAQEPGDTVSLTVRSGDDEPREVEVTLDEAESD